MLGIQLECGCIRYFPRFLMRYRNFPEATLSCLRTSATATSWKILHCSVRGKVPTREKERSTLIGWLSVLFAEMWNCLIPSVKRYNLICCLFVCFSWLLTAYSEEIVRHCERGCWLLLASSVASCLEFSRIICASWILYGYLHVSLNWSGTWHFSELCTNG